MINGFTISNLKQMAGRDGYIISCDLKYQNKKVGEFFDNGDGSMYNFYPSNEKGKKVEEFLKEFPEIVDGIGWDVGILVEELINQKETIKAVKKANNNNGIYVALNGKYAWGEATEVGYIVPKTWSDAQIANLAKDFGSRGLTYEGFTRYATIESTDRDFGLILD